MTKLKPIALAATATLAILAIALPNSAASELKYKFKDGMTLKVVTTQTSNQTMTGMMEMEGKQSTTMTQTYKLEKSDGDWFNFTAKTTEIKLDSGGMYEAMGMDDSGMAEEMKSLVTKGKVNASGKMKDFKMEGEGMAAMMAQADVMSKAGFLGFNLPEKPVNPGDRWSTSIAGKDLIPDDGTGMIESTGGEMKVTYVLKGVNDNIATITMTISGQVDMNFQGAPGNIQPNGSGTITFDLDKGHPTKIEQTFKMMTDLDIVQQTVEGKSTIIITS